MTKETLERCRTLDIEVANINERIANMRLAASGLAARKNNPGRAGQSDKISSLIAKIIEKRDELEAVVIELEQIRFDVDEWAEQLPLYQAMIIRLRYISCLRWARIADKIHMSESRCFELHQEALKDCRDGENDE